MVLDIIQFLGLLTTAIGTPFVVGWLSNRGKAKGDTLQYATATEGKLWDEVNNLRRELKEERLATEQMRDERRELKSAVTDLQEDVAELKNQLLMVGLERDELRRLLDQERGLNSSLQQRLNEANIRIRGLEQRISYLEQDKQ